MLEATGVTLVNVAPPDVYAVPDVFVISSEVENAVVDAPNVALIYNSSESNAAVAAIAFGSDKTATNGTFTIQFPAADASNAIIRIA